MARRNKDKIWTTSVKGETVKYGTSSNLITLEDLDENQEEAYRILNNEYKGRKRGYELQMGQDLGGLMFKSVNGKTQLNEVGRVIIKALTKAYIPEGQPYHYDATYNRHTNEVRFTLKNRNGDEVHRKLNYYSKTQHPKAYARDTAVVDVDTGARAYKKVMDMISWGELNKEIIKRQYEILPEEYRGVGSVSDAMSLNELYGIGNYDDPNVNHRDIPKRLSQLAEHTINVSAGYASNWSWYFIANPDVLEEAIRRINEKEQFGDINTEWNYTTRTTKSGKTIKTGISGTPNFWARINSQMKEMNKDKNSTYGSKERRLGEFFQHIKDEEIDWGSLTDIQKANEYKKYVKQFSNPNAVKGKKAEEKQTNRIGDTNISNPTGTIDEIKGIVKNEGKK